MFGLSKKTPSKEPILDDDVDPLAEADVYMAYGRREQAIGILMQAIKRNPGRKELETALSNIENGVIMERNHTNDVLDMPERFKKLSSGSQKVVLDMINHLLKLESN